MASNINTGDNAWLLISVAMVQLMCTSLGLFYGGMTSEKAVVNTIMLSFGTMAVVTVVWVLVGYSLAFAPSVSTGVIGDLSLALLNYGDTPRAGTTLPEASFSMFQLMFAAITPALISGAVVEKMNYIAFMWFAALWHIFVYCPLAHWIFFTQGWLATWGVIDFAGRCAAVARGIGRASLYFATRNRTYTPAYDTGVTGCATRGSFFPHRFRGLRRRNGLWCVCIRVGVLAEESQEAGARVTPQRPLCHAGSWAPVVWVRARPRAYARVRTTPTAPHRRKCKCSISVFIPSGGSVSTRAAHCPLATSPPAP